MPHSLRRLATSPTSTLDAAELEALLIEHAVPTGKIFRAPEMLADPHFAAREAIVHLPHPTLGDFPMQNVVPKLSATPGAVRWVGPELGEHNDEVYGGLLGLDEDERAKLAELLEFLATEIAPYASDWWNKAEFPAHILPKLAALELSPPAQRGYSNLFAGLVLS